MRKNKKGFTLIEIIVVVVVLAVLMAVAVPSVLKYIHEADDAKVYTVVRTYMNDIEIAKAKAMIDDQDETNLKWKDFEQDIADYLGQEKFYTNFFGTSTPPTPVDITPSEMWIEGYYISGVIYTVENNNGDIVIEFDMSGNLTTGNLNQFVDFSSGVNFTEYIFRIADKSNTQYTISCVPNGKITILEKTTY